MKLIGRSKISKLNPKPNITYPILRLPQDQADVIGEMAYIYETECNGRRAFLVMLDEIDPAACDVIQLDSKNDLETRVNRLESKMDEIVRVIGENGNKSESKPEKKRLTSGLAEIRTQDLRRVKAEFENPVQNAVSSNGVTLQFTREELQHYTASRTKGLSDKSIRWLQKSRDILWEKTNGELSASTLSALRESVLDLFGSRDSWSKVLGFTVAFLKYLSKVNFDQRYRHLEVHLELPKAIRAVKLLTSRIITTEDIQNTIKAIDSADDLSSEKKLNYKGMVMFLAYSGQRVLTGAQITVSQFKEALRHAPPVLTVEAHQDKIRLQHYVPIHPAVIPVLQEVIEGKQEDEVAFDYNGLMRWLKENPVPLARINGKIELKDLRKAFEQISDEIGFTDANKNFIMSHGVSSINWQSYKQFLPENVYKRYMECWGKVSF